MAHRIDKFDYKFCCGMTVGGVLLIRRDQFEKINGFSNKYFVSSKINNYIIIFSRTLKSIELLDVSNKTVQTKFLEYQLFKLIFFK